MNRKRYVLFLALGLLHCLLAGPTLAVIGTADGPEVRLPVSPPSAQPQAVRQIRMEAAQPVRVPPPPGISTSVDIPTPSLAEPPVFAENLLLGHDVAQRGPGLAGNGPEVRMGVSPPGAEASLLPPPPPTFAVEQELGPDQWKLSADRIEGQHDSEYIQAVGNVLLVKGLNTLKADFMRYYQASRWVVLKGNVRVAWEGDILEAEEAEFDLSNMLGWLKRGKVFVGKPHIYFQSETIRKYGASSYRFQNAKVTGCDGDKPAWAITAEEGDINIDGRTKLWHTRFNVKDTPVAYLPFMSLPGGARRQSGFLVPDISYSKRRGVSVNQPYYQVLDDERDLTFFENAMSSRGFMQGLEYRHTENLDTKGDWRFDILNDRKTAANSSQEELYLQGDGLTRPNSNRWWLRSKFNGFVKDPAWQVKLDLDMVSDQNYLREFGGGLSGFDASRKTFLREFGRDIDVADSLTRSSTAYLSRSWDRYGVVGKTVWTQNLAYMNGNNSAKANPTTQTIPEIHAFAFKDSIPGTPLEWEGSGRFDYFWRKYGTRGFRTDVHPTVSLPLAAGPVTVIPSIGLRTTSYGVGGYTNEPPATTNNKSPHRTYMELGFSAFTEMSRVFTLNNPLEAKAENVGKSEWGAVRHSVAPRLEFAYIPAPQSQNRLPSFDALDRIQRKNTITYSLTNVLDRRRTSVVAAPNGNATIPVAATDYLDFLRLRLEQSFDRDEAARKDALGTYARRPYSDIMVEAAVTPQKYVTLTSKTFYSPYLGRPTEHEHMLTLSKEKLGEMRFGYDYLYPLDEYKRQRTKDVQALRLGVDVELTDKLKFTSDYRMDIAGNADLEKTVGLTWTDQCYNVQLLFSRKPSDQSLELRFNLLDFGKP
ncbi:MAG: LPS assembly protein LptD [Humidesulfovibrio sp.]|uniref:LPS-assembly protein LptD n=1 Tax=Humidesulfovibrio sp. TaxID=2910988 RepID=UPI0027EED04F|nr:LPS assembly protein LptD [Humidesulfovibrio sp.]MDQ7835194.1 LPS assembly protein LptD [Humidesulfovibrio sp.]